MNHTRGSSWWGRGSVRAKSSTKTFSTVSSQEMFPRPAIIQLMVGLEGRALRARAWGRESGTHCLHTWQIIEVTVGRWEGGNQIKHREVEVVTRPRLTLKQVYYSNYIFRHPIRSMGRLYIKICVCACHFFGPMNFFLKTLYIVSISKPLYSSC